MTLSGRSRMLQLDESATRIGELEDELESACAEKMKAELKLKMAHQEKVDTEEKQRKLDDVARLKVGR